MSSTAMSSPLGDDRARARLERELLLSWRHVSIDQMRSVVSSHTVANSGVDSEAPQLAAAVALRERLAVVQPLAVDRRDLEEPFCMARAPRRARRTPSPVLHVERAARLELGAPQLDHAVLAGVLRANTSCCALTI